MMKRICHQDCSKILFFMLGGRKCPLTVCKINIIITYHSILDKNMYIKKTNTCRYFI